MVREWELNIPLLTPPSKVMEGDRRKAEGGESAGAATERAPKAKGSSTSRATDVRAAVDDPTHEFRSDLTTAVGSTSQPSPSPLDPSSRRRGRRRRSSALVG